MRYRIDRRTGNRISALSFGCMRFPGTLGIIDAQKTEELILRAVEKGVNYFDTAWIYSGSEEILGNILHKNNLRYRVFIATKMPVVMFKGTSASVDFDKYFNQSLERLKTDYIDYYLLHMITDFDQWNRLKNWGIESWLAKKKSSGQIKHTGFSFHGSGSEFMKIIDDYDWELTMIQYNYFDENFQAGVKGLRAAAAKMPVIIMEPLLGGKLASGLSKDAVKIFKNANERDPSGSPLSPAGWALNWLWNQEEVTSVLSGMNAMEQLEENLSLAGEASVNMQNDSQKAVYKSVLESINKSCKIRCTGCNYCMPCPAGVNIPGCFSSYNTIYSMGYFEGLKQFITSTGITQSKGGGPDLCTRCGKCVQHCPQNIPVMKELAVVSKKLEPWFVKFAGFCARAFLGNKRKKQ